MNTRTYMKKTDARITNLFTFLTDLFNSTKDNYIELKLIEFAQAYQVIYPAIVVRTLVKKGLVQRKKIVTYAKGKVGYKHSFCIYHWNTIQPTMYMTRKIAEECSNYSITYHPPVMIQLWPLELKEISLFY
jgi:hypothetical protein